VSVIEAEIKKGKYKGRTVKIQFGKPLKVMVDGKDVSDVLMKLQIEIGVHGQFVILQLAELDYSQVPSKAWSKMVGESL